MQELANALSRYALVTWTSVSTIPQRLGSSLAAAFGVAGVVTVLVAVLSIAEGFQAALAGTGSNKTAIVMRGGSDTEMSSILSMDDTKIIVDGPGVRRDVNGPIASAELFVVVDIPKKSTGTPANVTLRGVQPAAISIRRDMRIVAGRGFEPGKNEIIVGVGAARQFAGLAVGSRLNWGGAEWAVVGHFDSGGSVWESEAWCDASILQPLFLRGSTFQSVYLSLESADAFDELKDSLTSDPRVDVMVLRESDYFAEQSEILHLLITGLGFLVAGLMAVGAVFGAVNTMYSAVAARTREIATLRAIGFGGGPVLVAILFESSLLALAGGVVGGIGAWAGFNGYQATTLNWASFSQVTFAFRVTPGLVLAGLALALVVGLLGGLWPAIRAVRLPVATALREL